MRVTDNLEALYFPFSLCDNELELKKMVLLFDKVHFIYPQSHGVGFTEFSSLHHQVSFFLGKPTCFTKDITDVRIKEKNLFKKIKDVYGLLEEKNILSSIDPKPIIDEYDSLLTASIITDMKSRKFSDEIHQAFKEKYKNNKSFIESYEYLHSVNTHVSTNKLISWQLGMRGIPNTLKRYLFLPKYGYEYNSEGTILRHENEEKEELFIPFDNENYYFMLPSIAAPISINRAILTSVIYNLPLITDNKHFFSVLSNKSQEALKFLLHPPCIFRF